MEALRLLTRQVRRHPALLEMLQPFSNRGTRLMRSLRCLRWYSDRMRSDEAMNAWMCGRILAGEPTAIGKVGTLELELLASGPPITTELRRLAFVNVGVFPANQEILARFCDEVRSALPQMDGMAVFGNQGERPLVNDLARQAVVLCGTGALLPWRGRPPWSRALAGKKVLVVHPFASTIARQYRENRQAIWNNGPDILPEFELSTLRMPLSAGIVEPSEKDWFERLDLMRAKMEAIDFDVALVGAGGMSLPLVTQAKRQGAVGIHLGGGTQLLFGIRGRRWDESEEMLSFFNDSWTRPSSDETPKQSSNIEEGCYS